MYGYLERSLRDEGKCFLSGEDNHICLKLEDQRIDSRYQFNKVVSYSKQPSNVYYRSNTEQRDILFHFTSVTYY